MAIPRTIVVVVLACMAFAGCGAWTRARYMTYDTFGDVADKGYVDFRSPSGESGVGISTFSIAELSGERWLDAHPMPVYDAGHQIRRVAKPAGRYEFAVRLGNGCRRFAVEVAPGMVTPVLVTVTSRGSVSESGTNSSQTYFDMTITVEDARRYVPPRPGLEHKRTEPKVVLLPYAC